MFLSCAGNHRFSHRATTYRFFTTSVLKTLSDLQVYTICRVHLLTFMGDLQFLTMCLDLQVFPTTWDLQVFSITGDLQVFPTTGDLQVLVFSHHAL